MEPRDTTFRLCSSCKAAIGFEQEYFRCSVSTCNRKRLWFSFCTLGCWEAHRASERHRDAWAEPHRAPSKAEHTATESLASSDKPDKPDKSRAVPSNASREVLVVASRLKAFVKSHSGMNASERVLPVLSDQLRELVEAAAAAAQKDGRKTILGRDVTPLLWPVRSAAIEGGAPAPNANPENLVVVSKLKAYVRAATGMNTSDGVMAPLSEHLRRITVEAIRNAGRDARKTVLDRDFVKLGAL